jgi:hypothetical protein
MKLSKEQKRLAAQCVADVVRDLMSGSNLPSAKELKAQAKYTAKAVLAGFKSINAGR